MKLLKTERDAFLDKNLLVFISLPMKYSKDRRISKLKKKYKGMPFVFVFSNDLKKNPLYHTFFDPTSFITGTWSSSMILINKELTDLRIDISKLAGYKTFKSVNQKAPKSL